MRTLDELGISPAPWEFTSDGMGYNDIKCTGCNESDAEYEGENIIATMVAKTDARLIAAAPDCLMSLAETLDALKNRLPSKPTLEELEIIDRAEAAIRKATGESEAAK